jgi:dolichol-phosphate mannosyltransferase
MDPDFSVIAPMFNEEGAAAELVREIAAAFAGTAFEIVIVDDASRDGTRAALLALKAELPMLTVIGHARNAGQSRALRSGVLAARGAIVVTLDGDGLPRPADAPRLAQQLAAAPAGLGMIGGERVRRQDRLTKRWASRLANAVRGWLLGDHAADSGCGLKAIRRAVYLRLPFFDHQHRFLPALVLREGYQVAYEPVGHRPRRTGASKYTNHGRLWSSIWDILGMLWLRARNRDPGAVDRL